MMTIRRYLAGIFLLCVTFAGLFAGAPLTPAQVVRQDNLAQGIQETPWAVDGTGQVFLPLMIANPEPSEPAPSPSPTPPGDGGPFPEGDSVFGVNLYTESVGLDDVSQEEIDWMRPEPILWSSIEPRKGERNWGGLAGLEAHLKLAAEKGVEAVVIVTGTPGWAGKVKGSKCGPIKAEELDSFAHFMSDLVSRYSAPPYAVRYWELWNEPDVDPSYSHSSDYGCWGDQTDPYYGGGYYAEMLKVVYPAVKAAVPQAQLLVGGLLLGCDPRNPDQCMTRDPLTGKFFEGILRGGGADFFDGVSFHAFDGYAGVYGLYGNTNWGTAWDTTGPLLAAKAQFLKELLNAYGAGDRYLITSEAALMHPRDHCDEDCEMTKAIYATQIYATTLAEGLRSTLWYCLRCGWRQVDLVESADQPLPAYHAYRKAWQVLHNAIFLREVKLDEMVRIYEFQRGDRLVWVVWALDQKEHRIELPGPPAAAFNNLGASLPEDDSSLTVTLEPIYLEWAP